MEFNNSARADSLLRRVLSTREMTETFEGRLDFLYYRHVSFSVPDGLTDGRHITLKVKVKTNKTFKTDKRPKASPIRFTFFCSGLFLQEEV